MQAPGDTQWFGTQVNTLFMCGHSTCTKFCRHFLSSITLSSGRLHQSASTNIEKAYKDRKWKDLLNSYTNVTYAPMVSSLHSMCAQICKYPSWTVMRSNDSVARGAKTATLPLLILHFSDFCHCHIYLTSQYMYDLIVNFDRMLQLASASCNVYA